MKALYQALAFDPGKVAEILDRLFATDRSAMDALEGVVIGDGSCSRRYMWLMDRWLEGRGFDRLAQRIRSEGGRLVFQLPLVVKESELSGLTQHLAARWREADGFITGDLGLLAWLSEERAARGTDTLLVFTSNVINPSFSTWLGERLQVDRVRPLMHRRTFVEETIGLPKDVVVYGNMLLNCSTFCLHSEDLPVRCTYGCETPKRLVMEHEEVLLLGRSLYTRNRLDLRDRLEAVRDLVSATVLDLDLSVEEIASALSAIARHPRTDRASPP